MKKVRYITKLDGKVVRECANKKELNSHLARIINYDFDVFRRMEVFKVNAKGEEIPYEA